MENKLIKQLEIYRSNDSYRELARKMHLSHSYVVDVMLYRRPLTWNFAHLAAVVLGINTVSAFTLAGLLPTSVAEKGSVGATGVKE